MREDHLPFRSAFKELDFGGSQCIWLHSASKSFEFVACEEVVELSSFIPFCSRSVISLVTVNGKMVIVY